MAIVAIEAPENRSLPGILVSALRATLLKLNRMKQATAGVTRALKALAGFAKLKVRYDDLKVALDCEPEPGLADSGDLELDLADLLLTVGEAAREQGIAAVIDELQYVPEEQLAALISALHRASQHQLPITMVAAGLPPLLGQMGREKSYAERLFEFVAIGSLDQLSATAALRPPIEREGEIIDDAAITAILAQTQGYPYFPQEWGKHSWNLAEASPISADDVAAASITALAELDATFFRVRFDRLTPTEKRYLHAMASLGPGRTGQETLSTRLG